MADIIEIGDTPDDNPLNTGGIRRKYNKSRCGGGYKSVKGKCVKIKDKK